MLFLGAFMSSRSQDGLFQQMNSSNTPTANMLIMIMLTVITLTEIMLTC